MPPTSSSPSPLPAAPLTDVDTLDTAKLREALRSAHRELAARERHLELLEQLAGIGSWEIDLATDRMRWSRSSQGQSR